MFRVLFLAVIGCIGFTALAAQDRSQPRFTELSPRNMVRLDRQRALISATVREQYGPSLTQTTKDLPVLQRLIDDSVFTKSQTYELQCLGIAFGDVLASALPLGHGYRRIRYGSHTSIQEQLSECERLDYGFEAG